MPKHPLRYEAGTFSIFSLMLVNFTNFLCIACTFLHHINHCLGRFFPLGGSQLESLDRPFKVLDLVYFWFACRCLKVKSGYFWKQTTSLLLNRTIRRDSRRTVAQKPGYQMVAVSRFRQRKIVYHQETKISTFNSKLLTLVYFEERKWW